MSSNLSSRSTMRDINMKLNMRYKDYFTIISAVRMLEILVIETQKH